MTAAYPPYSHLSWFNAMKFFITMVYVCQTKNQNLFIFYTSQRLLAVPEARICIFLSFCVSLFIEENKSAASIWEASTSEICWLITTFLREGYWVLILASNQRLHIYSPLAKAKQGCGFAGPSVSGRCPLLSWGLVLLSTQSQIPNSRASSLTTTWSQWARSAEERQFGAKGWFHCLTSG